MVCRRLPIDDVRRAINPVPGPVGSIPRSADVVIAGAGPIGLTAANLLGSMGVTTVLLERNAATADLPRALAVDDEYMRLLDRIDLLPAVEAHRSEPFGIYFYSRKGKPIVKVPAFTTRNGFGNRSGMMQPVLEKLLLDGTRRYPALCVRYGSEITGLAQDAAGVRVDVTTGDGTHSIDARYLLACDGARSFVRTALGIPFQGTRIDEPHLVLDLAEFPDNSPYSRFYCTPQRPLNSIPTPYGGRRLEFMLNPDDDRDTITGPDSIRKLVDECSPYAGTNCHVIRSVVYSYSQRIAGRMQDGRVFLLGDAAHVMPPFGAQAMNTGARDVHNLCWKLRAVLNGTAGPRLPDTYETERRPQVEAIVRYSVSIGRLANLRSRPAALLRDLLIQGLSLLPPIRRYLSEMRYMPRPRLGAGFVVGVARRKGSLLGQTFPRAALERSGEEIAAFDRLADDEFALVSINLPADALPPIAAHPVFAGRRPRLIAIGLDHFPSDIGGVTSARLADPRLMTVLQPHAGQILLVRPDRYIALATLPAGAPAALAALMRCAMPPPSANQNASRSRSGSREDVEVGAPNDATSVRRNQAG